MLLMPLLSAYDICAQEAAARCCFAIIAVAAAATPRTARHRRCLPDIWRCLRRWRRCAPDAVARAWRHALRDVARVHGMMFCASSAAQIRAI